MIDSGNFAGSGHGDGHGGYDDSDMIARARAQAQTSEPEPKRNSGGPGMGRRAFIGGACVLAAGLAGFGAWMFFGQPKEKTKEPDEKEEATKTEPKLLEKYIGDGTPMVAGKDIAMGYWTAQWFDVNEETWLEIDYDGETYTLPRPQLKDNVNYWANQTLVVALYPDATIRANATMERVTENELPVSDTDKIPPLHAGMLLADADIICGTWGATPKEVLNEIDPKTGLAVDGDLTWSGRVTGLCAEWAKENKKTMEELQEACQGVIVLDRDKATELFGPVLAASLPYSAEEALMASGEDISDKTAETNTEKTGENATTGEAAPTEDTAAVAAPTAAATPAPNETEVAAADNTNAETSDDAIPVTKKTNEDADKKADTAPEEPKTLIERKEGNHMAAAAVLASYFSGKTTEGFTHINKEGAEIVVKKDQFVLPILTDMILIKPASTDDSSQQSTSVSSTSQADDTSEAVVPLATE